MTTALSASTPLAYWLAYQERTHPKAIDLGLERSRAVAQRLGLLPARATTLTVAGTNGKGSSVTLAAAIYQAAGYRTGRYTSPHLLRYNERVAIDGVEASDVALCRAFAAIEAARGDISLTYFEFGTLAALWLFREAGVEVQVLEVGLGGRLDSVNIVDADCALVTNIGLDHIDWLGSDRDSIGYEKAGIMRPGRPAVSVEDQPPRRLIEHAASIGAQLRRLGPDYDFARHADGRWDWRGASERYAGLPACWPRSGPCRACGRCRKRRSARRCLRCAWPGASSSLATPSSTSPTMSNRRPFWRIICASKAWVEKPGWCWACSPTSRWKASARCWRRWCRARISARCRRRADLPRPSYATGRRTAGLPAKPPAAWPKPTGWRAPAPHPGTASWCAVRFSQLQLSRNYCVDQ